MKTLHTILLTLFFVAPALAQERPAQPATQIEVNAGLIHNKYVAPDTLSGFSSAVKGGTNDDTAALQALLNKGGRITLPATNYTSGALWVTNNTVLSGYGARIDFLTNLTAATQLNFASNVNSVLIQGVSFNGGNTNDCYNSDRGSNSLRCFARPWVNSTVTFRDLKVSGFDIGIKPTPFTDPQTVMTLPRFNVIDSEFAANGYALVPESISGSAVAEYLNFSHLNVHDNSYGFYIAAGNIYVVNNLLTHNRKGVVVDGSNGLNPGHGMIADNTVNHALGVGSFVTILNCPLGEYIVNNTCYTASVIDIQNSGLVQVVGNQMDFGRVQVSVAGPGPNYVHDNTFKGSFNGENFVYDFVVGSQSPTTNIVSWNNVSVDQPGADDSYHWNPYASNSIVYFPTNLPPAAPLTFGGGFLWNSNADHLYLLRSSKTGKAWVSTNLIN